MATLSSLHILSCDDSNLFTHDHTASVSIEKDTCSIERVSFMSPKGRFSEGIGIPSHEPYRWKNSSATCT